MFQTAFLKRRATVFLIPLVIGILSSCGCSKKLDLDEAVLVQLKKAGSDLSKPHKIDFYLYFPTKSVAEQAALSLRRTGFEVVVKKGADDKNWLCLATKPMILDLPAIRQTQHDLDRLAASLKGNYDGWEAGVEK